MDQEVRRALRGYELEWHTRSGSPHSSADLERVAAGQAHTIVLLHPEETKVWDPVCRSVHTSSHQSRAYWLSLCPGFTCAAGSHASLGLPERCRTPRPQWGGLLSATLCRTVGDTTDGQLLRPRAGCRQEAGGGGAGHPDGASVHQAPPLPQAHAPEHRRAGLGRPSGLLASAPPTPPLSRRLLLLGTDHNHDACTNSQSLLAACASLEEASMFVRTARF